MTTRTKRPAPLPNGGRIRRDLRRMGVGYLQVQSKARTKADYDRAVVVVRELVDDAQVAVLEALHRRRISIEQLVDMRRHGRLTGAGVQAKLALREPLWAAGTEGADDYRPGAVKRLLGGAGTAPATAARYVQSFATLRRKAGDALPADATVASLALVDWRALARTWGNSAADWNNLRRAVARLLSLALDSKVHPERAAILARFPTADEEERTPDLTVDLFHQLLDAAPEHVRPAYMTLALTGMRDRSEYLRCTRAALLPHTRQVKVPGSKTKGSKATVGPFEAEDWAWIVAGVPAPVQYKMLRRHWIAANLAVGTGRLVPSKRGRTVTDPETGETVPALEYEGLRLHDLRHLHGQLAADGGVHASKIQRSLRHATPAMTARYTARLDKGDVARAVGGALRGGTPATAEPAPPRQSHVKDA